MNAKRKSRVLMLVAAVIMIPAFVTPLWTIHLTAPQYSDGLGMHIYVHDVRGHERHDIQNINILNHYIGMQPIEPEEIPELEIMPWVLGGLIATGLLAAAIGHAWVMAGWLGLFLVAGAAGMVDFYLWNIDYGHNLSPDAPIRIPDMTYSPPIIGTSQILNIRASSYPHLGSLFLGAAALLSSLAVFFAFKARRSEGSPERPTGTGSDSDDSGAGSSPGAPASATGSGIALLVLLSVLGGCDGPPPPVDEADDPNRIVYGQDLDPFCGDTVETVRWGGEVVTHEGERLRFRSTECMAGYLLERGPDRSDIASVKVVDFPDGWKLIDAETATYLKSPNLYSPTGLNILAIESPKMQGNLQDAYTGPLLNWQEVLELVAREWRDGGPTRGSS